MNCTESQAVSYLVHEDRLFNPEELSICNDTLLYYPAQLQLHKWSHKHLKLLCCKHWFSWGLTRHIVRGLIKPFLPKITYKQQEPNVSTFRLGINVLIWSSPEGHCEAVLEILNAYAPIAASVSWLYRWIFHFCRVTVLFSLLRLKCCYFYMLERDAINYIFFNGT